MRGKLQHLHHCCQLYRITPAYAGKTQNILLKSTKNADHPRVCGENALGKTRITVAMGSPPRMRGKRRYQFLIAVQYRITPAGAGKTQPRGRNFFFAEDHPRRCGENRLFCGQYARKLGSPPQVRGKLQRFQSEIRQLGITPAGAGKTLITPVSSATS